MRLPLAVYRSKKPAHEVRSGHASKIFGVAFVTAICIHTIGTSPVSGATKKPAVAVGAANAVTTTLKTGSGAAVEVAKPAATSTSDLKADIEAKIASVQREAAPGLAVGAVSCPATLAGKKSKVPVGNYSCTILIEGTPAPYTVIVKEGGSLKGGVFQISPAKAIIDVTKIVSFVKTSLDPADAAITKISCGKSNVIVADPGAAIVCTLTRGKAIEKLNFEVRNVNGLVALKTDGKPAASSTTAPASGSAVVAAPSTAVPKE